MWKPTTDNINRLPEGVRRFIHDLETFQYVEMVQENHELRENLKGALALVEYYRGKVHDIMHLPNQGDSDD